MWEFILFLVISFYISSVFGVDKFRQSCAQNSENEKKKHDSVFLLYLTNVIKADRYFKEHSREIIDEVSDDLKYIYVNVNIKMTKKWKIKMYIFQDLLLSL